MSETPTASGHFVTGIYNSEQGWVAQIWSRGVELGMGDERQATFHGAVVRLFGSTEETWFDQSESYWAIRLKDDSELTINVVEPVEYLDALGEARELNG